MQRVLGLAIFVAVVLLSCAAEATELRELLQELLDEKENEGEHSKILTAIETVNRGTKYAEDTKIKIGGIENEEELKATLKPICKKFVREVFGKSIRNLKGSLFSAKGRVEYHIKNQNGGKRLTDMLRELLSDAENEEKRDDAAVDPGELMKEIIRDLKAVTVAYQYNLGAHENLEQDLKDLLALIASVGNLDGP